VSGFSEMFSFRRIERDDERSVPQVMPPWHGPSEDELGTYVPLSIVIARSDRAAVALAGAVAYSTGVVLHLAAAARGLRDRDSNRFFHEQHMIDPEEPLAPAFLRFGLELTDGTRVSNLEGHHRRFSQDEPDAAVLVPHGGGGGSSGGGRLTMRPAYWLWPLPPEGAVQVFVEWPALDIELTRTELDAAPILAAAQPVRLWP